MRQYAALLERRVQSSTRVRKVQAVTRQTNPIGRSMIEMLGVLAIIGVLSVGGIAGYSKAMTKWKINKSIEQISLIITNIKTLYAQQKNYNGLNNASAYSLGIVPDEASTSLWQIDTPFNGYIYIEGWCSDTCIPFIQDRFIIDARELPREACIALATTDWGASSYSGLIAVSATYGTSSAELYFATDQVPGCSGGTSDNAVVACPGGSDIPVPMPPEYAAKACNCKENTCSLRWYYQ